MRRGNDGHGEGFEEDHRDEERRRRRRSFRLGLASVLGLLLVIFIAQNAERVDADFVFFDANVRLIWIMLGCAATGLVIGILLGRTKFKRRERERKD